MDCFGTCKMFARCAQCPLSAPCRTISAFDKRTYRSNRKYCSLKLDNSTATRLGIKKPHVKPAT